MPPEIPVTQARAAISDLVNRVAYGGERIALTRHGRTVAALVSAGDLERLRRLDALEAGAARAVSELGTAPLHPFGIAAHDTNRPTGDR